MTMRANNTSNASDNKEESRPSTKPKTIAESYYQDMVAGKKIDFKCYQMKDGMFSQYQLFYKIQMEITGNITIFEIDPKLNDSIKSTFIKFNINSINQILFGKIMDKQDPKLIFLIDGLANGLKNNDEVSFIFRFENQATCLDLVENVKFILNSWKAYQPKSEVQFLNEYYRRG